LAAPLASTCDRQLIPSMAYHPGELSGELSVIPA